MGAKRYRPSPATLVAAAALLAAGAGIGTAASGLISGSQIKPGTITGRNIKNHSIGLVKLKGRLPAGRRGATGPQGPQGTQGAAGPQGPAGPITGTLPSGVTLKGWFNLDTVASGANQINGGSISFGLALRATPSVTIIPVGGPSTAGCPGSVSAPTATSGNLCLYESTIFNNNNPATDGGFFAVGTTPFGTELFFHSAAAGRFYVDGTWAVTG